MRVRPGGVVGHSSGEIAAAYAAGAISMEAAIIIAYYRGYVASRLASRGRMAVVGLSVDEVVPLLTEGAVVACENSPNNTTVSGESKAVLGVLERVKSLHPGVLVKSLNINVAYHSRKSQPFE